MTTPKSFRELEEASAVTSTELIDTMRDYAEGGWGIAPRVVLELVEKTKLKGEDLRVMLGLAETGFKIQNERRESEAAREYREVADRLKSLISS